MNRQHPQCSLQTGLHALWDRTVAVFLFRSLLNTLRTIFYAQKIQLLHRRAFLSPYERLKEHDCGVDGAIGGSLGLRCRDCGCRLVFSETKVVARNKDYRTREIIEAAEIERLKNN